MTMQVVLSVPEMFGSNDQILIPVHTCHMSSSMLFFTWSFSSRSMAVQLYVFHIMFLYSWQVSLHDTPSSKIRMIENELEVSQTSEDLCGALTLQSFSGCFEDGAKHKLCM
jgi:hypothetical protein